MGKKLTITLTDRLPVTVDVDIWPVIARSSDCDSEYEFQANRRWKMFVRQCQTEGDDRCIVYGIYGSNFSSEPDCRGGEIVDNVEAVPAAAKRVAAYLDFNVRLADELIADLPAEEL